MKLNKKCVKKCVINNVPKFYKMCLLDWCNLYDGENQNSSAVPAQPLWNNKHIKIAVKSVYFRNLSHLGINCVKDLIDNKGKFKASNRNLKYSIGCILLTFYQRGMDTKNQE